MSAQEQAFRLWALLDDIDTLDDACKADDAAFRAHVRRAQQRRFTIMSGEQWEELHEEFGQ